MNLQSQRRLASRILKVGKNRVWIDPDEIEKVSSAITRDDVKRLIHEGRIQALPKKGSSRGRHRVSHEKRLAGRGRGPGGRKGPRRTREDWVQRIRSIRRRLRELRERRIIDRSVYRRLSHMASGGAFRSSSHVDEYIKSHQLARRR
jgi:large subunit ribosomal protein L19e